MAQFLANERFGDGSDGNYAPSTGTDAPIDSACTGTAATKSLSATNGSFAANQLILIHQSQGTGAGQWELNRIASYVAGTITTKYALAYDYVSGAQVLVMSQHRSGNVAGGVTISLKAWDGTTGGIFAKYFNGVATIAGTINAVNKGYRYGQNPGSNQNNPGRRGEGTTGNDQAQTRNAQGNGGGGGDQEEGGGGGGNATAGGDGEPVIGNHGYGGALSSNTSLTVMTFGGGGGSGGVGNSGGGKNAGDGGTGGGIVLIIGKTVTITGSITSNGGAGTVGQNGACGSGGGGSGGCVLIKTQGATLGASLITASAGSGGSGGSTKAGGIGSVGRIHVDYSSSLSGTTSPTLDSSISKDLGDSLGGFIM